MTVMVSNLTSRHKLHGQIGNKRNIRNIKRVKTKSALSSNRKRWSIGSLNSQIAIGRTHREAPESRYHGQIPREETEGGPKVEDWEAVAKLVSVEVWVTEPTVSTDVEVARRWSSMRISCVSEPVELLSDHLEPVPPIPCEERWAWAFWAFLFL
jgi:hypothetical protein